MAKHKLLRSGILIILIILGILAIAKAQEDPWAKKRAIESPARMGELGRVPNKLQNWPPRPGQRFPSVELFNHNAESFDIESLRGKPTLVEFIAMTCAGCQAFTGGNKYGGFEGLAVQANLKSIHEYFKEYTGGLSLEDPRINFLQIVIYNHQLRPAQAPDLARWRKHFRLGLQKNAFVVSGGDPLANGASFRLIPGFMLLDRELNVLYDSAGHSPPHNLFGTLLPAIPALFGND